ncbi:hypothetical protein LAZ67_4002162 [Cordylochernes scorpioides]|uniref:Uncharacterized protein n=1 Tax=Cordylochernes scorpioides TaxID=51811 RepID=A0ABY6KDK8_9ARAC|nr:hypothetical protein LAZ67_4002162 [Cordylochernes scorpioides]
MLKVAVLLALLASAHAGPLIAGTCYAGCAALAVACFSAAGFVFGTVPGAQIAAVPALVKCNLAFGACEAACVAALVAPTPRDIADSVEGKAPGEDVKGKETTGMHRGSKTMNWTTHLRRDEEDGGGPGMSRWLRVETSGCDLQNAQCLQPFKKDLMFLFCDIL